MRSVGDAVRHRREAARRCPAPERKEREITERRKLKSGAADGRESGRYHDFPDRNLFGGHLTNLSPASVVGLLVPEPSLPAGIFAAKYFYRSSFPTGGLRFNAPD